jgi:hypothetical protein
MGASMAFGRIVFSCSFFLSFFVGAVQGIELENYFDMSGGYRFDRLSTKLSQHRSNIKVKNIRIEEIGAKGRYTFYNDMYIRGSTYYGNVMGGDYRETSVSKRDSVSLTKAHAHKGIAEDTNVGLGYLYSVNQNFGVGAIGGWTYNRLSLKMHHAKTHGHTDHARNRLKYKNRWNGPWLGIDFMYRYCNFSLDAGYEYHWAHWHAEWKLKDRDHPHVFSDRRQSKDANGRVGYIEGRWDFCPCWNIGLGLKAQDWLADHGRMRRKAKNESSLGLSKGEIAKVKQTKWVSYSVTVDLGYTF